MSEIRTRIYAVVVEIPRGRVVTYGQVAAMAGAPRHARQVGNKGNSGIQYRSKQSENGANKWVVNGYQADFANGIWGKLYEEGGRGALA